MKEYEKKQCTNIAIAIGTIFLIGVLLGNIIVSHTQEEKFVVETSTKKNESIILLKKPQYIESFLYKGTTTSNNDNLLDSDVDISENEEVICTSHTNKQDENNDNSTKEEKKETTTKKTTETTTKQTVATTKQTATTKVDNTEETTSEEEKTDETTKPIKVPSTSQSDIKIEIGADHYSCSPSDIYCTYPARTYTEEQKELIAKMLYCEAGSTSWDCQVATCSAIINFIEYYGGDFSVLDNANKFSPAPYYRYKTPTKTQYNVLKIVLSGRLIADIKYFRINHYHSFGTPMFAIDNVYFSK